MKKLQLFIILLIFTISCSDDKINNINNNNEFGAPSLISPSNDTTNVSTILLLDWSDVTNASSYTIQIAIDSQFINVTKDTTLINSIYSTYNGLLSNNLSYYWRVRAQNQSQTSTWSSVWNFKTSNFNNQYIIRFDSIGVNGSFGNNFCGINLLDGTTVLRDSASKDVQLIDSSSTGMNFYLRSGDLSDFNIVGFQTRFSRIYTSLTPQQFDTISVIPVGRDTILPNLDFTSDDTYGNGAWSYFNVPLSNNSVYSFYLKGKSENVWGRNIYGILQARESGNSTNGYRMSFRVRINVNGDNNF